jgi:hypothetical protein
LIVPFSMSIYLSFVLLALPFVFAFLPSPSVMVPSSPQRSLSPSLFPRVDRRLFE